jgi:hypothetical protein
MTSYSAVPAMETPGPVPIESRALGTLSYIRSSIDAAGSLAVPGAAGIVMGTIGMIASALTSVPALHTQWLGIWLAAAIAAFLMGGMLVVRQATERGRPLISGPLRKFLLCLCPALIAGAMLTFIFWQEGLERFIPGAWLLLYGSSVISASTVTNASNMRVIILMGTLFVVLGLAAFALPAPSHTLILGLGFGLLHLIFGLVIGRMNHGD